MTPLRFTLRADGVSDAMLVPIIRWTFRHHLPGTPVVGQFAEWHNLPRRPRKLVDQLRKALDLFPCDVLIVHRDAENEDPGIRADEIQAVADELAAGESNSIPVIPLVPVRMSEAWLLFDVEAIRSAARNPNGTVNLGLPGWKTIESISDPKATLNAALEKASELTGRRLAKFVTRGRARQVAEYIEDFSPLRRLAAFQAFEADVREFAAAWLGRDGE